MCAIQFQPEAHFQIPLHSPPPLTCPPILPTLSPFPTEASATETDQRKDPNFFFNGSLQTLSSLNVAASDGSRARGGATAHQHDCRDEWGMGVGLERLGTGNHPVCSPGTFQFSSCGLSDCLHAGVLQRDAARHTEGESLSKESGWDALFCI